MREPTVVFHISEDAGIERFEPRPSEYTASPVVWGIDDERLRNYLLPRDCPRVTLYAGPKATVEDRERYLGTSRAVVAIEEAWLQRLRQCVLFCYHLPADTFVSHDETAGYYVSQVPVVPVRMERIADPLAELHRRGVDVRVLPDLWDLRDSVIESSLEFSIIRMRNARPQAASGGARPAQQDYCEDEQKHEATRRPV